MPTNSASISNDLQLCDVSIKSVSIKSFEHVNFNYLSILAPWTYQRNLKIISMQSRSRTGYVHTNFLMWQSSFKSQNTVPHLRTSKTPHPEMA